ncbi:MAG: ATP-binding protein [Prevotella sp.]|nr:ATP-binding protein [Muribaculaceae bacterium]MCM1404755.1 ATP-binding protein [Prevotella sp.]
MDIVIKRDMYLNRLIAHKHNGLVKIISGLRRCGKSYLLFNLFKAHLLKSGVKEDHIITLALDDYKNKKYRNPDACYDFVMANIKDTEKYYVLIDEIQMLNDFVDVLNGFLHIPNLDIYVTGSSSKLISSEVVTEFRGRGDEIRVYPLSFSEYYAAVGGDWWNAWKQYSIFGGMPATVSLKSDEEKIVYLDNLFRETYLRDIIERKKIRSNIDELGALINVVASGVGGLLNPKKLENTFKSKDKSAISAFTIKRYLSYLEDSFIISKALRYDIKGKKYISTPSKYYFTDIGLRNSRLNFRQQEETHIMENIIYNELKIRGFAVDVGNVNIFDNNAKKQVEVDFVANLGDRRYYIQSATYLPTDEKRQQEERPLLGIKDGFKKIIIIKDDIRPYKNEKGISIIGLKDFLLNPDSLDL